MELLELARRLGPEAPTLCEGWTTHDLLAHLWVREHVPAAVPGLVVPALHGTTERNEREARERFGYEELIDRLAHPPRAVTLAEDAAHVHEFFVHHEDVRRANGLGPREPNPALERELWRRLRLTGWVLFRRVRPIDLVLHGPGDAPLHVVPFARGGRVDVRGPVPELFLLAFGRTDAAQVSWSGDPDDVARVRAARLGP
jgi:uncharacterized protein (TIGR03085 family)